MTEPLRRIAHGAAFLLAVVLLSVCGFRFIGGYGWIESLWMVVVTISTVGFSEHSTLSPVMQLFVIVVIVLGMSASVYTIGGLIQLMLEGELERLLGKRRMTKELNRLLGHVIICGYGRIGRNLAVELRSEKRDLVILETDPVVQEEAIAAGYTCVIGDATDESVLNDVGVIRASTLVTALHGDAENVFITLTARNMNPKLQIIARAELSSTERKLRQAGADQVVMPTVVGARLMSRMITRPTTADLMQLVSQSGFNDLELDELVVPVANAIVGVTVGETQAHRKHKLLIVALKSADGELVFSPDADQTFRERDTAIVLGHANDIQRFREEYELG